ncbi:homoserine O-succinyltransferase [Lentibacillus cibarius]|uniref:Homoserine O-acetyltransferase n=1 Tax=Lentibacillus cibarius TaxID=2583219 RepID=A0A549YLD9_9BACI|nr:homoserine O-succinyltransferase [Lentibacillus cibarius]TRM12698.1 homoserine O-succinyltransferase [Lentibacillus cibarius]
MPINIPKNLPARDALKEEKIFVMDEGRAVSQDIRPLNILIVNLMPEKERTELQILRLLGNTPLQINITFLRMATHKAKTVSEYHLDNFYKTFGDVKHRRFDGMIITGAPIEHLQFEDVNYWEELTDIMEWSKENVTSSLHVCWGAQAALYYHYGIDKVALPKKVSGIYQHRLMDSKNRLLRGFDEVFNAPHSRYTDVPTDAIVEHPELNLLATTFANETFMAMSKDAKHIMVTGHLEYDATTLADEYARDLEKGIDVDMPQNYFPNNDVNERPLNTWRSHSHLLFSNWLNYFVYQQTPFIWE